MEYSIGPVYVAELDSKMLCACFGGIDDTGMCAV